MFIFPLSLPFILLSFLYVLYTLYCISSVFHATVALLSPLILCVALNFLNLKYVIARKEATTTTAVAAAPMATSIPTGGPDSHSLSACMMSLETLCSGAGISKVKLNALPVHAVTLVWTETMTVSSSSASFPLETISQLEIDARQPAPIASHHCPLMFLTSLGLSWHCTLTSVVSGAVTTVCVQLIFRDDKIAGLDHRWHINLMPSQCCSHTAARHVCGDPCMMTLSSLQ
jgi:hypothetical protein